jgi:hypothetical protein
LGILVGAVTMAVLYFGIVLGLEKLEKEGFRQTMFVIGLPSLFLVPLCSGAAAAFCWRRLKPGISTILFATLMMTVLVLAGATIIAGEGVICLIIVSPLLYGTVLTGAIVGHLWFRKSGGPLQWCLVPVLAFAAAGEPLARSDRAGVVADEIRITASPEKVWSQLTAFPEIPDAPDYWLFRLGLPYPTSATGSGAYVGADRQCIFSGNMVFGEKIVECRPNENLTFDITELPPHPELIGHITPTRGQFLLRDNGDGTTTLTGTSWYTLHVRPLWYSDWWTEQIVRAVHLRVMEDIRRRAEQG